MTVVGITNGTTQAHFGYPLDVVHAANVDRQFGNVSFLLPRTHPAFSSGVIRDDGGMLLTIDDGDDLWAGVVEEPEWLDEGVRLTATEVGSWVEARPLPRKRQFRGCPAGAIAEAAFRDAFIGLGTLPITLGSFAICPPLIRRYDFTGRQQLGEVLAFLVEETGQEWVIDHTTYAASWRMQAGIYREGIIVDMGELFPTLRMQRLRDRYQSVREQSRRTKREFVAWGGTTPPLWPAQHVLEVS